MKFLSPLALSLAALASCNSVDWVDYGDDPMTNPAFMADMTAAGAPGAPHEALASRAGSWKVDGKVWMAPGAEPMPMPSTANIKVILGGRVVVEEFKCDFMGMPFEGRLIQGYDNLTDKYWSVWTDNMSSGYMLSHGTVLADGSIEFRGTASDILTPKGRPMRMVISDNEGGGYTMRMYDTREGVDEYMSMELHYSR